jgi:hypothetical protein
MQVGHPLRTDGLGRIASAGEDAHIRDLIEQVLFTTPGERVNRPTFGTGILQFVFAPNSAEVAGTLQFLIEGALTQWLGDLLELRGVEVLSDDATLQISIAYVIRRTRESQVSRFTLGMQA